MAEGDYQSGLIKRIKKRWPDSHVLKNDSGYQQGIPDLSVFMPGWWCWLEVKPEKPSETDFEPNQLWFIGEAARMSFGAVIYPENEEEVLCEIQRSYQASRTARLFGG